MDFTCVFEQLKRASYNSKGNLLTLVLTLFEELSADDYNYRYCNCFWYVYFLFHHFLRNEYVAVSTTKQKAHHLRDVPSNQWYTVVFFLDFSKINLPSTS